MQRLQGGPCSAPTHFIFRRRQTVHALRSMMLRTSAMYGHDMLTVHLWWTLVLAPPCRRRDFDLLRSRLCAPFFCCRRPLHRQGKRKASSRWHPRNKTRYRLAGCLLCPILVMRGRISSEGQRSVGLCAAEAADMCNRQGRGIKKDRFGGNEQVACLIGERRCPDGAWI